MARVPTPMMACVASMACKACKRREEMFQHNEKFEEGSKNSTRLHVFPQHDGGHAKCEAAKVGCVAAEYKKRTA